MEKTFEQQKAEILEDMRIFRIKLMEYLKNVESDKLEEKDEAHNSIEKRFQSMIEDSNLWHKVYENFKRRESENSQEECEECEEDEPYIIFSELEVKLACKVIVDTARGLEASIGDKQLEASKYIIDVATNRGIKINSFTNPFVI